MVSDGPLSSFEKRDSGTPILVCPVSITTACSLADTMVPTGAPLLSRSGAPALKSTTVAGAAAAGFVVGAAAGETSAIAAEAARNKTEAPPIIALNLFMIFPVSGLITLTKCQFRDSIAMGRLLGSGDLSVRSALLVRGSL